MKLPMPCIVCGKGLAKNYGEEGHNQPYGATAFTSHGHYGSTVYDPMDGHFLEINVCDNCLRTYAYRVAEGQDMRLIVRDGTVVGAEEIPVRELPPLRRWDPDAA